MNETALLGDDVRVPVFVTNVSGERRDVEVRIRASAAPVPGFDVRDAKAPVEIVGDGTARLALADGEAGTAVFRLKALAAAGAAKVAVEVTSGDLRSADEAEVPLLPAGPRTRQVRRVALTQGANDLTPYLEGASRDLGKRQLADGETEVASEDFENSLDRIGEPSDLDEVLELDERHRRDQHFTFGDGLPGRGRKSLALTGVDHATA